MRSFTIFLTLLGAAAYAESPSAKRVTYDEHMVPIFREHCFACHNQDKKKGGLRLDNYTSLRQGGSSGEVIKPGDPEVSSLYLSVAHKHEPFMPPKSNQLAKEKLDAV